MVLRKAAVAGERLLGLGQILQDLVVRIVDGAARGAFGLVRGGFGVDGHARHVPRVGKLVRVLEQLGQHEVGPAAHHLRLAHDLVHLRFGGAFDLGRVLDDAVQVVDQHVVVVPQGVRLEDVAPLVAPEVVVIAVPAAVDDDVLAGGVEGADLADIAGDVAAAVVLVVEMQQVVAAVQGRVGALDGREDLVVGDGTGRVGFQEILAGNEGESGDGRKGVNQYLFHTLVLL